MGNILDAVEWNDRTAEESHAYERKSLDSAFSSFGEAVFAWTQSNGYEKNENKIVDGVMVKAFCNANKIPHSNLAVDDLISSAQFFGSDQWLFDFLEKHGFFRVGQGKFIATNDKNQPICYVAAARSFTQNLDAAINGDEKLVVEFYETMRANLCVDETLEKKSPYAEVVIENGMSGAKMTLRKGYIENVRIARDEYYPYLAGGVRALIEAFMESEESVLILMGEPGTGKTSAVSAAVDELNLMPIYAKKTEVVLEKGFVQFICQASDAFMQKVEGSKLKKREDMFTQSKFFSIEHPAGEELGKEVNAHEEARVPIMIVEDADELMAPRNQGQGNLRMAELLNETDGIGSNHTRKLILTTNLTNTKAIDEALLRPGRCFEVVNCRRLTLEEAIVARSVAGLPDFTELPKGDVSLAEALRKPRKKIAISQGKATLGFTAK